MAGDFVSTPLSASVHEGKRVHPDAGFIVSVDDRDAVPGDPLTVSIAKDGVQLLRVQSEAFFEMARAAEILAASWPSSHMPSAEAQALWGRK